MCAKEMTSNVENIETEAERILGEARSRANETFLKANEESSKILSSELPMDEVKKECEQIINRAKKEVEKKVEEYRKKASEIKTGSSKRVEKITERIVSKITGAELK